MEAVLALDASFDRGHCGLGMALLYGGRPEESIAHFVRKYPTEPAKSCVMGLLDDVELGVHELGKI